MSWRTCLTFSSLRLGQLGTGHCLHTCSNITSFKQGQALCLLEAQNKPVGHFTCGKNELFPRLPSRVACHQVRVSFS